MTRTGAGSGPGDEAMAEWQLGVDAGAAAGGALDYAGAAEEPRPLPHAQETEAARRGRVAQAHPVVAHVEVDVVRLALEDDLDACRAGVLARIGQGFLKDSERGGLDGRRRADIAEVLDEAH